MVLSALRSQEWLIGLSTSNCLPSNIRHPDKIRVLLLAA